MTNPLLERACAIASSYLESIDTRTVGPNPPPSSLYDALGGPLADHGLEPEEVIDQLARHADPGIVASAGGRYFGFVVGGSTPASLAADWLVSAWDQNAGFYALSPAAAIIEEIVADWLLDVLRLPRDAVVGFVTGCQMANFMGIAAGRQSVLERVGWDAARGGLTGAPPVRIITSAESHGTIDRALSLLGFGADCAERVPCDEQGRMVPAALRAILDGPPRPTIVCAQAGNVNSGSFDPLDQIGLLCRDHGAWLHVDGAFGLWAAACPSRCALVTGHDLADSWATDAHKWLNVPYDSGVVIVRDRAALLAATNYDGAYLVRSEGQRDPCAYAPESSRRARAIPIYAALRSLGRRGVADLIDRHCSLAVRAATRLADGGAEILNDIVLNQVLVTFPASDRDQTPSLRMIIERVQRDGTCWLGGTRWRGRDAIRLSVCGWRTTEQDIDRSVDAILRCAAPDSP